MNYIFLVVISVVILAVLVASKMGKIKEREKKNQEKTNSDLNEKIIRPEKKLHEEEKGRWENEYWKRQNRGER